MPGVNGYHGDPYPGGGGAQYLPPTSLDGYDPYNGRSNPTSREDPYHYSRSPARDPYATREDPYSSRLAGPVEDPYARSRKVEDPYSQRKPEDPYASRKPEDPYSRRKQEDPYHHQRHAEEDPYTRVNKDRHRNGAGPTDVRDDYRTHVRDRDGATSSFPHYEMDHLATFKVESRQGVMSPMDGIRKLRHMELSSGVWTMRITLVIEPQDLIVIDRASGEDIERFPVSAVSQPTAVTNDDRRDIYNNIVLFTVTEDGRKGPQSEMHLFQCIGRPAHEVVDDIKAAKAGKIRGPVPRRDPEYPGISDKIKEFEQHAQRNYIATQGYQQDIPSSQLLRQSMHRDDNESVLSDHTDQEVSELNKNEEEAEKDDGFDISKLGKDQCQQLLNHCFDDIEKFIGRLQSAAEAYRELDIRRKQRVNKKSKHPMGDGMLSMRARPPPAADFIDVFQKFKLSFNLLARLKPHIHDPNAPELVHFLFTPLSLVVEASKDPRHGSSSIAQRVLSPMLTAEAKELLMNCLSSKETSLWNSLGDAWTLSRDEYRGHVPPYIPRFSDGWEPPKSWLMDGSYGDGSRYAEAETPYRQGGNHGYGDVHRDDPYRSRSPAPTGVSHARALAEYEQEYRRREERRLEAERQREEERLREMRKHEVDSERDYPTQLPPQKAQRPAQRAPLTFEEEQRQFVQDLQQRNARVAEATHPRKGKNNKELTLQKGEFVEIVDSSKNWWKVRNAKGETGHAPYTILQEVPANKAVQQNEQGSAAEGEHGASSREMSARRQKSHNSFHSSSKDDVVPPSKATGSRKEPSHPDAYWTEDKLALLGQDDPDTVFHDPPVRNDRQDRHPSNRHTAQDPVKSLRSPDRLIHNLTRNPLQENITNELKRVQNQNRHRPGNININTASTEIDVERWLEAKGFSSRVMSAFRWYNGEDMFRLSPADIVDLAGSEATRLENQLVIQKKLAGYPTEKTGELEEVLRERKRSAEPRHSGGF